MCSGQHRRDEADGIETPGGGSAADSAAAAICFSPPPPLPLPPGLDIASLASTLKPVGHRKIRFRRSSPPAHSRCTDVENRFPALLSGGASASNINADCAADDVSEFRNEDVDATVDTVAADPPIGVDRHAESVSTAPEDSVAEQTTRIPESPLQKVLDVSDDDQIEPEYLWAKYSDTDIMAHILEVMNNADAFSAECDELFTPLASREGGLISLGQVHRVTQSLIHRLGARDPEVLERISFAFATATTDRQDGLGRMEFRGYIASVLTQVLRELEARRDDDVPAQELNWAPENLLTSVRDTLLDFVVGGPTRGSEGVADGGRSAQRTLLASDRENIDA